MAAALPNNFRIPLWQRLAALPAHILQPLRGGTLLDLGCGLGEDAFRLQHLLSLRQCTGVDQLPAAYLNALDDESLEQEYLQRFGHPVPLHPYQFTASIRTQRELYERLCEKELDAAPMHLEAWHQTFSWHWDTDVREFVNGSVQQFDLILCGGLLHWLPAAEQGAFLHRVMALLAPGGLLALEANVSETRAPVVDGMFVYPAVAEVEEWLHGHAVVAYEVGNGRGFWVVG